MQLEKTQPLKGKIAIVTGSGRGIGRSIARRLSLAGANVALAARTADQLDETRRMIERDGGTALAVPSDVTKEADVDRLVEESLGLSGRLEILVNNVGSAPLATIDRMEPELFDHIIASNIRPVYLCCRAVWPIMTSGGCGAIVNISSVAAQDPFPGFAAYGAAKAFVNTYTRALAAEGREAGIRVYGVAPGAVDTQMLRSAFPDYPADKMLSPDDVAMLVESLLSPAGRYVSGETITIRRD
jgi:NAD(P)-dependent dehydrogenase (short-subunit alcohol dehydrogenase family)